MRPSRPATFPAVILLTSLLAMLPALFSSTLSEPTMAAQDQNVATTIAGRPVTPLHGVWRSRGYGYVLRIGPDELKLFHTAGSFCYADP